MDENIDILHGDFIGSIITSVQVLEEYWNIKKFGSELFPGLHLF